MVVVFARFLDDPFHIAFNDTRLGATLGQEYNYVTEQTSN